jgi:hypothetical protein
MSYCVQQDEEQPLDNGGFEILNKITVFFNFYLPFGN